MNYSLMRYTSKKNRGIVALILGIVIFSFGPFLLMATHTTGNIITTLGPIFAVMGILVAGTFCIAVGASTLIEEIAKDTTKKEKKYAK